MSRFIRRSIILGVVSALVFSMTILAASATAYTPLGELTDAQRNQLLQKVNNGYCTSCPTTRHYSPTPHMHQITHIDTPYIDMVGAGPGGREVVTSRRPGEGSGALAYEKSHTISNSYSLNLAFDQDVISAELGFDVSYSDTTTASWSYDVPNGYGAEILCWNVYEVTDFTAKTTYSSPYPLDPYYHTADGTARQWLRFEFDGRYLYP